MSKIVVLAHDSQKPSLLSFLKDKQSWFFGREIVATGRSADLFEAGGVELSLQHVKKGSEGGYLEIIDMIKANDISMVFFFRDPSIVQPYHQDILDLIDACDYKNVPIATNQSAAELLIIGKIRMEAASSVSERVLRN